MLVHKATCIIVCAILLLCCFCGVQDRLEQQQLGSLKQQASVAAVSHEHMVPSSVTCSMGLCSDHIAAQGTEQMVPSSSSLVGKTKHSNTPAAAAALFHTTGSPSLGSLI